VPRHFGVSQNYATEQNGFAVTANVSNFKSLNQWCSTFFLPRHTYKNKQFHITPNVFFKERHGFS